MTFRRKRNLVKASYYQCWGHTAGQLVDHFKFLVSIILNDCSWDNNVVSLIKKVQQQCCFLKVFGIRKDILVQFYQAVMESVLTFCHHLVRQLHPGAVIWLTCVMHTIGKTIGCELSPVGIIFAQCSLCRVRSRLTSHSANGLLAVCPVGRATQARTSPWETVFNG